MTYPINVLKVAVPSPLRQLFDYLPSEPFAVDDLSNSGYEKGVRVRVSFNRRRLVGVVVGHSSSTDVPPDKLLPAIELLDEVPVIQPDILALCTWSASYYHHPMGDVIAHALPVLLRQGDPSAFQQESHWSPTLKGTLVDPETLRKRSPRQADALAVVQQHASGLSSMMLGSLQVAVTQLRALEKKGLAQVNSVNPRGHRVEHRLAEVELTLNSEQQAAFDSVDSAFGNFQTSLLNGVTGSGKTEIYLQLIHQVLLRGEQALVLVPEIGLTPQTINRFQRRFSSRVVALHSGLNNRERLDGWLHAKQGSAGVVIGTRSAIFTPFKKLGIIIVDEEHDGSFKQQDGFRYSARDLSVYRARQLQIPVLMGTATPCLESWVNATRGRYELLPLTERAGKAKPPSIEIIDIRKRAMVEGFAPELLQAMTSALNNGEQVLVFVNRRGFAPTLMCHDCGWLDECRDCDVRLTVHKSERRMSCHHCGLSHAIPRACPDCGSPDLWALGQGTEKIEEFLTQQFADFPVVRIDRDSTRRKNSMLKILDRVNTGEPMILVGTQMIAKGHHFPNVTLVAIKDADAGFFACDFRASEKMAQLLIQVAGRSGRSSKPGKVLLQSHQPEHPGIQRLIKQGYPAFVTSLLEERRMAEFPPYTHLALLRCDGVRMQYLLEFLQLVRQLFSALQLPLNVLGPIPAPMQKRAGNFRAQLLLQSTQRSILHRALLVVIPQIEIMKESRSVRWSVDVDPIDLS